MRRHLFYIVLFSLLAANSFAGTWTVINTNDANAGAVNSGDLRWCINQALGAGVGPHTINFAIVPAAATYQININSMLPAMYSGGTITIDATTQSGWAGTPIVIIRGNSTGFEAIQLGTGTYTVKGLIFQNLQRGITVYDGSNHLIQNCWFGLSSAGTSKVGNALTGDGIYITKGPGTKIGGTGTNQGNVISGACDSNGDCGGIRIDPNFNSGTSNILIQGNYIGTDYTGNNALAGAGIQTAGNSSGQVQNQAGIYIQQTQNDPITIDRNVVSNNLGVGIDLNNQSNKITVIGNMIGTNTTGMQPLGNYCVGMRVRTNFNTVIGGATAAERNIISANGIHIASIADATSGATNFDHFNFCGIFFQNAQWAQVMGNYIGTDATGNATSLTMGNFYGGVKFLAYGSAGEQTANITLGGNTTAHGNVIGGNGVRGAAYDPVSHKGHGVLLQAGGNTSFNVTHDIGIYNNYIGISPSGANIGNQQDGISFYDHVDHITIGGAGLRNYIANNSFGVFIQNNCQNNTIAGNYIGTTINGMGAAPNLSGGICIQWNSTANTIGTAAAGNVISGHNGNPGISFKDAGSGLGTGDNNFVYNNYIGLASDGVTQLPNGIGILIQGGSKGNTIGGTGANQRNYISGNSPGNAIEMENADNNIISGNYIGLDKNGTVPGAVPNAISNNLHGIVMTAGYTPAAANGSKSRSSSDGNTISNNVISNNVLRGLSMDSSNNNTIQSNIIGLNPAGTASMSNGSHGIFLSNGSGNHFVSNVISSNKEMGIYFFSKAINNFIESNMIGTDITGTIALGNNFNGILITGSSTGNTIGGNSASKRNYICANGVVANSYNNAISIETNSHLNVVEYNFLGVSKNNMPMGNASHGISVDINSDDVSIIRNVISANKIHGIIVQGGSPNFSDRAVIQGNYIGTDSAGLQTVPVASIASSTFGNGIVGVIIKESTGSQFGGSGANQGNIVANSKAEAGLLIVASTGTKVFGNKIGVNKNNVDAGNFTNGITLRSEGITPTSNNIIGGVNAGESNTIWNNKVNGIEIDGSSPGALSNSIHKNSISCNLNRGIVLTSNGNNSYPKPVILGSSTSTLISGTATAGSTIEVYGTGVCNTCAGGASDKVQGKTYLGTTTANGSGNWSMAFAAVNKDTITATASEANTTTAHNTSEFAVCALCATLAPTVSGPQTPCVNATGVKYFISGGSATSNFVWTVPSGATQTAGVTSDTVYVSFGSTSGNLSVTETDLNNCSGSANYAITLAPIPATPTISAGGPTTFCIPGNVTLTASSSTSGVSFQWYESAATIGGATNTTYQTNASGSYTVVASKGGCSSPASAATAVTANPAVTANATGTAGGVCAGSSINLQANASGGSGLYNYSWTASGSSFTSNQANPSTNAPSSSTFYIVSVTDQANANCSVVDSVTITVVSVSVDAGGGPLGQQKLCAGENFLIDSDTSGGVGPYTFTWTAAVPADLAYLSNTSILHPTVTPTANGSFKYYLSVHDAGSTCADVMDSITIIMNPLPMSQISSSDTLVCAGADAVLVAQITIQTAGPYTYTWSETFGLLADSITTTTEPTFTINPTKDSASFCVEVTDVNGCISPCTEVPIKALNTQVLVVPNLMTPNNDNLNDCFIIRDINNRDILPGSSFEVYNRWGEAVHKAEDYTNKRPWCGNALNDGMYYYHIKTGCGKKDLRGWLQVIGSEAKNH